MIENIMYNSNTKTKRVGCFFSLALLCICIVFSYQLWSPVCSPAIINVFVSKTKVSTFSNAQKLTKLIHIAWHQNLNWMPKSFDFNRCEYKNCILSEMLKNTTAYQAVIFHYRLLDQNIPKKPEGQIWILWNTESPANDKALSEAWESKFDWSATYRSDSEITNQRTVRLRDQPITNKNYSHIYARKQKSVAWVVSNCHTQSKRHLYVKELQKYIDVDIFGKCSTNKSVCRGISMAACHQALSKDYKFYLGFENSICKDYITEKLHHAFLDNNDIIYVYRGAPNVDKYINSKTFINTVKFNSPKSLGEYLKRLGSDKDKYTTFLKEKDKYMLHENKVESALCSVCRLLNTYKHSNISWSGRNFNTWFREGACRKPNDIPS